MIRSLYNTVVLSALALAGTGACMKESSTGVATVTSATTMPAPATAAAPLTYCPMTVTGTSVQATQTPTSMNMTFTTSSGDVTELRRRVHEMAAHVGVRPTPERPAIRLLGELPPVHVAVRDVANGAELEVMPVDPNHMSDVRNDVETCARMMTEQHDCPLSTGPMMH